MNAHAAEIGETSHSRGALQHHSFRRRRAVKENLRTRGLCVISERPGRLLGRTTLKMPWEYRAMSEIGRERAESASASGIDPTGAP